MIHISSTTSSIFISFLLSALLISRVFCGTQVPSTHLPPKHVGHADECNALLQFKNSLTINKRISNSACAEYGLYDLSSLGTASWKEGSDCCTNWDGIKCDNITGNVITVDLTCSCLEGNLHSNTSLFSLRHLANLSLGGNHLAGPIPSSICRASSLKYLDLSYNDLNGTILPCLGSLSNAQVYAVVGNRFTGEIPSSLCNITTLFALDMSDNSLSGEIPQCLGTSNLEILNLSNNSFRGLLPEITAPHNCSLKFAALNKNQLKGKLPLSWALCKNLASLDLSGNELGGTFPVWLGALQNLSILILRSNKFYGQITPHPSVVHPFPMLQIFDISNNNFNGALPTHYISNFNRMVGGNREGVLRFHTGYWNISQRARVIYKRVEMEVEKIREALAIIDLSRNYFQDQIPNFIGDLHLLKGLNLSFNNLRGVIPSSLGNLTNLESLDLSSNNFTGEIPAGLISLTSLAVFNVSMNRLTGKIPQGKQFDTFQNDSFRGNPGLCGLPLSKPCIEEHPVETPSTSKHEDDEDCWMSGWRAVLMGYGTGIVIGISICYIFIDIRRPPMWLIEMVERWRTRKVKMALQR